MIYCEMHCLAPVMEAVARSFVLAIGFVKVQGVCNKTRTISGQHEMAPKKTKKRNGCSSLYYFEKILF